MIDSKLVELARKQIRESKLGYRTYFIGVLGVDYARYGSYHKVTEEFLDTVNYKCTLVDDEPSFELLDYIHVPVHSYTELFKELNIQNSRGWVNITNITVQNILKKHGVVIDERTGR
ncbi:hypothetical protein 65p006 [Aeromonas phage 65]|uniref:Uncharacterized protein n=2 Tax=Ishigurovirus osborne TaxID=260149 RepID=A0A219YBR4_9CAUD|nr:hypothetical protein ST65p006 [Aeromonas phage 65]AAR90933.1 hypothetical protein 65p006 [Aeromonas phage 65]APU01397.1 hypothetical protein [Aeromonas phage 65.2]